MREIKFRAFDKEIEEFYYTGIHYDDHFFEFDDSGYLKAFRIDYDAGSIHEPPQPHSTEIEDPQQFTGLKDKNGKEIYEGDIVKEGGRIGTVRFSRQYSRFEYTTPTGRAGLYGFYGEVIGNIFQNSELIWENRKEKPHANLSGSHTTQPR